MSVAENGHCQRCGHNAQWKFNLLFLSNQHLPMSIPWIIRPAVIADLRALAWLETQCFETDALSARSLRRFVRNSMSHSHQLWVAQTQGAGAVVVGYILILYRCNSQIARLYSLAVHPHYQGRGIASCLLQTAEQDSQQHQCRCIRLEVQSKNWMAQNLYQRRGYCIFKTITGYYENGDTALRMEKCF